MLSFLALILITNMTNLMSDQVTRTSSRNVTIISCVTATSVNLATNLIAILMRIYIPFLLMITFNWVVILRLRESKKKVGFSLILMNNKRATNQNQPVQQKISRKEYKFTVAMIVIDVAFFVLNTPLAGFFVILIYNLFSTSLTDLAVPNAYVNLFNQISQLMSFGYSELMIFIFVALNKYFRDELLIVFRLKRFMPNQVESLPTRTNTIA